MPRYSRLGMVCRREESEEMSIDGLNQTDIWGCFSHAPRGSFETLPGQSPPNFSSCGSGGRTAPDPEEASLDGVHLRRQAKEVSA
jgi:hypothetical protein